MTNAQYLLPRALLKALGPARDGEDVGEVIADLAAAGRIEAIADHIDDHRYIDHVPDRNEPISTELWRRIGYQGKVKDVWNRGTVRLESDVKNHLYYVEIIGIKFEEEHVRFELDRFGLVLSSAKTNKAPVEQPVADAIPSPIAPIASAADLPSKSRKPVSLYDKVTVTIDEAVQLTSLGRTTINARMKAGILVSIKAGRRTLITTDSIRQMLTQNTR